MRWKKNWNSKLKLTIIAAFFLTIVVLIQNVEYSNESMDFNDDVDCENGNLRLLKCSSSKPGEFSLSVNRYYFYADESIELSWTPSENADYYEIYYGATNNGGLNLLESGLTELFYQIDIQSEGIKAGTYNLYVLAINGYGQIYSNQIEIEISSYTASEAVSDDGGEADALASESSSSLILFSFLILIAFIFLIFIGIIGKYKINQRNRPLERSRERPYLTNKPIQRDGYETKEIKRKTKEKLTTKNLKDFESILGIYNATMIFLVIFLFVAVFAFTLFTINLLQSFQQSDSLSAIDSEFEVLKFLSEPYLNYLALGFVIILFLVLSISITYAKRRNLFKPLESIKELPRGSISHPIKKNGYLTRNIKTSKECINDFTKNEILLPLVSEKLTEDELERSRTLELTSISDNFLHKVDDINWEDELQKARFIREMLALTPEEREEIIDYMLEKSRKEN